RAFVLGSEPRTDHKDFTNPELDLRLLQRDILPVLLDLKTPFHRLIKRRGNKYGVLSKHRSHQIPFALLPTLTELLQYGGESLALLPEAFRFYRCSDHSVS